MNKMFIFLLVCMLALLHNIHARNFDSARIYTKCMTSTSSIRVNNNSITSISDSVIVIDNIKATQLNRLILRKIVEKKAAQQEVPDLDIRLYVEFFKDGKISSFLGFAWKDEMYINEQFYQYRYSRLSLFNKVVPGLTALICVK